MWSARLLSLRKVLDDLQAAPVEKPDVDEKWITVTAEVGDVRVRIVKPVGSRARRRSSSTCTARYPVASEQAYATARWITAKGAEEGLDASRPAVAGDSVGGDMTAAPTLMARQRGDVTFVHQSLYHPVTDAGQDTENYREFANGPYLIAQRAEVTASPLRSSLEELRGLPPALVVVDENDMLRDAGEVNATLHDFMMLNPLRPARSTTAAVEQAIHTLRTALRGDWEFFRGRGLRPGLGRHFGAPSHTVSVSRPDDAVGVIEKAARTVRRPAYPRVGRHGADLAAEGRAGQGRGLAVGPRARDGGYDS